MLCQRERAGVPKNVRGKFIEIEIPRSEWVLAGVGAREREEVLNDVGEALGLVAKNCEGFAVLGGRAVGPRKRDLRFTAKYGDRRAQFVRGIGDEAALALKGIFQPVEQIVEGDGELSEFIALIRSIRQDDRGDWRRQWCALWRPLGPREQDSSARESNLLGPQVEARWE